MHRVSTELPLCVICGHDLKDATSNIIESEMCWQAMKIQCDEETESQLDTLRVSVYHWKGGLVDRKVCVHECNKC